jgi:hypothetical protein
MKIIPYRSAAAAAVSTINQMEGSRMLHVRVLSSEMCVSVDKCWLPFQSQLIEYEAARHSVLGDEAAHNCRVVDQFIMKGKKIEIYGHQ